MGVASIRKAPTAHKTAAVTRIAVVPNSAPCAIRFPCHAPSPSAITDHGTSSAKRNATEHAAATPISIVNGYIGTVSPTRRDSRPNTGPSTDSAIPCASTQATPKLSSRQGTRRAVFTK